MNKLYYQYINRKLAENGLTGVDVEQADVGTAEKVKALGGTSAGLMVGIFAGMIVAGSIFWVALSTLFLHMLTMMYCTTLSDEAVIYEEPISVESSSIADIQEPLTDSVSSAAEVSVAPYDFYEWMFEQVMDLNDMSEKSAVFLQEHPQLFPTFSKKKRLRNI